MNFDVMGMSCAACSSHVQKAVESVEGVKNVNVNLLTNSMSVDGDFSGEQNLSEKIILAVQKAGYDAKIVLWMRKYYFKHKKEHGPESSI